MSNISDAELPDVDYCLYTIPKDQCGGFCVLYMVFPPIDFLTGTRERRINTIKLNWQHLKDMNVCKANYICCGANTYPEQKSDIAQQTIFEFQLQKYVNTDDCSMAILNDFPIFLYDYFK